MFILKFKALLIFLRIDVYNVYSHSIKRSEALKKTHVRNLLNFIKRYQSSTQFTQLFTR